MIFFWNSSLGSEMLREGRKEGKTDMKETRRPGVKQQNVFSQPLLGDNNTDFHVACTPKPGMSLASVRRSPNWSCDESKKSAFLRRSRFISFARTQVHMTPCPFVRICLHVTYTNKNLGHERVTTFLTDTGSRTSIHMVVLGVLETAMIVHQAPTRCFKTEVYYESIKREPKIRGFKTHSVRVNSWLCRYKKLLFFVPAHV